MRDHALPAVRTTLQVLADGGGELLRLEAGDVEALDVGEIDRAVGGDGEGGGELVLADDAHLEDVAHAEGGGVDRGREREGAAVAGGAAEGEEGEAEERGREAVEQAGLHR